MADYDDKDEALLKQLIYSSRAREVLAGAQSRNNSSRSGLYSLLAVAATIVLVLGAFWLMQVPSVDRQELAERAYTFPKYVKPRGGSSKDLLALYGDRLNTGARATLVDQFVESASTTEEMYYLAHLLYEDGQLQSAQTVLDTVKWNTPFYEEERLWLGFLIAAIDGVPSDSLRSRYRLLPDRHQAKASGIIDDLD